MKRILIFIKKETVLVVAILFAVISMDGVKFFL